MKDPKAALIDAIYSKIAGNEKAREQFKKDFKLDDKQFEKMAKKFLDMWLDDPDLIMMLSEMLGIYAGEEDAGVENDEDHDYIV